MVIVLCKLVVLVAYNVQGLPLAVEFNTLSKIMQLGWRQARVMRSFVFLSCQTYRESFGTLL